MALTQKLLDFFLPAKCLFCDSEPSVICRNCLSSLLTDPLDVTRAQPQLGLHQICGTAVVDYSPQAAKLISAFKEQQLFSLAKPMAELMVAALLKSNFVAEWQANNSVSIVLVPIPSTSTSKLKRGFVPAQLLAQACAQLLRKHDAFKSARISLAAGLVVSDRADQAKLDRGSRFEVSRNSMKFYGSISQASLVLLIDDLITTGASIFEARRAISQTLSAELLSLVNFTFLTFAETSLKLVTRNEKKV